MRGLGPTKQEIIVRRGEVERMTKKELLHAILWLCPYIKHGATMRTPKAWLVELVMRLEFPALRPKGVSIRIWMLQLTLTGG